VNIVAVSPIVTAVQAALAGAGLPVDVGVKPEEVPDNTGWVVIYPSTPASSEGSMAQPYEQSAIEVQLVFVGRLADQATWAADRARPVMLPGSFTVPGRAVVWVEEVASRPLTRDDDKHPPLYSIAANYQIRTTPA
jgi:hypothetical protein